MKKFLLLAVAMLAIQTANAQEDALVFFEDKAGVEAALENPLTILTQDALDRKDMHGVAIDERDVPVNENYIALLKAEPGITVYSKSKWMNAAYVRGSQTNIENLVDNNYVSEVEFMNKSLNLSPIFPSGGVDKFEEENGLPKVIYNYGDATNQTEMIGIDFVHEQDFTGEGMVVAFMDNGYPNVFTNPAFSHVVDENRFLGTYDFPLRQTNADGTGTHGANTLSNAAAIIENEFVGTAPDASYYLFVTEYTSENPVEEAWWVEALERADSLGVDVVNTSLGYQDYDDSSYTHSYSDLDGQTTIAARGANHAFDKGMLLVTSAGNDGNGFGTVATPADAPGVLSIGAVDSNGNYTSFSSRGPTVDGRVKPDVMAQGESAAVVDINGNVTTSSGTSFSGPIMAGAVASLWQSRPVTTNGELMQIIRESAHLYNNPTDEMGYGIPNFETAYLSLQALSVEDELLENNFAIYPNPLKDRMNISFPSQVNQATLTLYNILGSKVMEQQISISNNSIEVSNLKSGVYLASISADGKTNSFKVIKE
ncbi:putative exported serine protease, subtilase family protein [unidentified eubacterium SCB49]|nr:putative exported serine protease, subtilase family protein [unidentified eubacterium SCB49]